jgi:tRNA A37 threonylcarbamoyladenosine dehydratase
MIDKFERTKILLGDESMKRLSECRVAVFGVGGVGGYVCEALARSGIGQIDLIDNDRVCYTNLNRQIIALNSTIGRYKVDVMADRIRDINPDCIVNVHKTFYLPPEARSMKQLSVSTNASDTDRNKGQTENGNASDDTDKKITGEKFDFATYDYVVDAIDTVTSKISLIEQAKKYNVPIICAMGAGNKLDPTKFEVADISKTSVCPLARIIRNELKKRKITKVKCVYSKEPPIKIRIPDYEVKNNSIKHKIPGSSSFAPPVVGLIIAGEVIKDLIERKK